MALTVFVFVFFLRKSEAIFIWKEIILQESIEDSPIKWSPPNFSFSHSVGQGETRTMRTCMLIHKQESEHKLSQLNQNGRRADLL